MTPNANDIILGGVSLRDFADAVNRYIAPFLLQFMYLFPILLYFRNMTRWWGEEWSDLPATFSIHDFVKSTNMVEETIQRNIRKGKSS